MKKLLIANRGEIAIRVARSAADLGIATVAIFAEDDEAALHVKILDEAVGLGAVGVAAYLDGRAIVEIALARGCDAVHPGYGFLSENAAFARACEAAGLIFVGPRPETLALFGDKAAARQAAEACDVPLLPGMSYAVSYEEAHKFFEGLGEGGAVMLKALTGGGGRGMRAVERIEDLRAAFERCGSEALQAFGSTELYVEELFPLARHIEVQIVGDGQGGVTHLWDRECSLQRQRQKLIEIAPAFGLDPAEREGILASAVRLGQHSGFRGLCTMEFLVDARSGSAGKFVFMEANPRIQVEHTVTEAVLGLDLVAVQLQIANGATLIELGLSQGAVPSPRGVAVQARVNLERMGSDGNSRPTGGVLEVYEAPSGPGVRVDGFGYAGYETSPRYDSLLAKVIVQAPNLKAAVAKARRALSEFKIEGVDVNIAFLQSLLKSPALSAGDLHTRYVDEHVADLLGAPGERTRYFSQASGETANAGIVIDPDDPLAVLTVGASAPVSTRDRRRRTASSTAGPPGTIAVEAPLQGTVSAILVSAGDEVRKGQPVAVLEALKMEHQIAAGFSGVVREIAQSVGATVFEGAPIIFLAAGEVEGGEINADHIVDLDEIRPDLARIEHFRNLTRDQARPDAVTKRHDAGKRTARENIEDLCDHGSFHEYGAMVTNARRYGESRESLEARMLRTPADGIVMGVGRVNGDIVGTEKARCIVLSYDYTVLAGTQGSKGHHKTDRMLELAEKFRLPVIWYTEGGGGRTGGLHPGDLPPPPTSTGGLKVATWRHLGRLSGLVPLVGVTTGRCFAGNAVALALCDVIIATSDSTIGIGGPAMIEGGGLGRYAPEEVGPVSVQEPNGVIDIVVEDEAEATAVAKQYLSYFQGRVSDWTASDQRTLRQIVPENRRAPYDVRKIVATIGDEGSMLELRPRFGVAMVTAFIRVEGRPIGVIANNNTSPTGGAVDADAADKAARFMQLCDAFDVPIVSLIDVPGNMVGPQAEETATIRHCGRLYVIGANLSVPFFSVVLRKAYGLGALAMSGGGFDEPFFVVAWPTGELAGMGLEGQVKLGQRAQLAAIKNIPERKARYEEMVASAYNWASALNGATVFEFDDVIDPAETRRWVVMGLESAPRAARRDGKKHPWIDTW